MGNKKWKRNNMFTNDLCGMYNLFQILRNFYGSR